MTLSPELKQEIDDLVHKERVLLFMKGTRRAPQCGFSAAVVEILDELLDDYATVDVLARGDLRDAIKEYSDWPTIPQLYVGGELLGGADIVRQMHDSGELAKALGVDGRSPLVPDKLPAITVTEAAAQAIAEAAEADPDGPHLHLEISPRFEHGLFFDAPSRRDLEVKAGPLTIWIDPDSASRADNIVIDYVDGPEGSGFKITNPNKGGKRAAAPEPGAARPTLPPAEPPRLTVTDAARAQFLAALEQEKEAGDEGEEYGVRVGARRMGATKVDYELGIISSEERRADDLVVEENGVRFYMDPLSARNLDGASIDFVDSDGGGSGFKFENPKLTEGWKDPLAARFQEFLDDEINPSIASHGGYVQLLDLQGDTAYVLMGGGCQGCSSASVTLYQGIAERVRQAIPEIQHLIDTTDHAAGTNPYYQG